MVELLWMLQVYQGIKMYAIYLSPNPSNDAIVNNSVYSA